MTMKHNYTAILAASALAFTLASCDDDFKPNYSTRLPIGILTADDGYQLRLESIGDIDFFYAEDGCLEGIGSVDINVDNFVINENNSYNHGRETESRMTKYSFNSRNLVSGIYERVVYDAYDYTERSNSSTSISYNYEGQLFTLRTTLSSYGTKEGVSFNLHENIQTTAYYDYNVLKRVECTLDATDNGDTYANTYTYYFNYGDRVENVFYQYTHSMAEAFFENEFDQTLACLGLFGYASYRVPTSIDYEYVTVKNGTEEVEKGVIVCDYAFYRDGAIAEADGARYKYSSFHDGFWGVAPKTDEVVIPYRNSEVKATSVKIPSRNIGYPSQIFSLRPQR